MIDQDAVSRLIRVLQSLRDSGKSSGEYGKVWDNGTVDSLKNLDQWFKSSFVVSEAKSAMHDLEKVRNVLTGLSASLDETVMDIKKYIRPFELGTGLASIPDELLSDIFVQEDFSLANLSLVCRRFRRVVLNTPRLWSHLELDGTVGVPYVRAYLKRSKSVGLSINLVCGYSGYEWDRELPLLAEVIPHLSRLKHLHVWLDLKKVCLSDREKIHQSASLINLHLPSLQSFSLEYDVSYYKDVALANDDLAHFYQSWNMPTLRSFYINIIPKPFIAPKLSSVKLGSSELSASPTAKEQLRNFLLAFPDLQALHITLSRGNGEAFHHTSDIYMPSLRILDISTSACQRSGIRSFMTALRAPLLRKMEIKMLAPKSVDDRDTALDDFFPHEDYPALQDLTLTMEAIGCTDFRVPFKKLRGLRSLSLDTPSLVPYIPHMEEDAADELVPALRTLVLTGFCNNHFQMLKYLRDSLLEQNLWHCFKELEVSSILIKPKINWMYGGKYRNVTSM